jgi:hypothetical protein
MLKSVLGNKEASSVPRSGGFSRGRKWLARHSKAEAALMAEAVLCLAAARLGTLMLPFRWVAAFSATMGRRSPLPPEQRAASIRSIAGVVTVAARHTYFRAACLQQALALQYMLRRRGVETVLNFGVTHDADGALAAHAWVSDDEDAVIIGGAVGKFTRLAQFPRPGPQVEHP